MNAAVPVDLVAGAVGQKSRTSEPGRPSENGACACVQRERKPNEREHNADHPINEGGEAPGAPKVN